MSVIDEYLAPLQPQDKAALERIRQLVKRTAGGSDQLEEVISYAMPGFKYKGKYLLTFAAFKDHLSLFPGATPIESLAAQLKPFKTSKGTIQFTHDKPLPDDLLVGIIRGCLATIDNHGANK